MTRKTWMIWSVVAQLAVPWSAQGGALRAGAAVIDITPRSFPVSVNGGMRDRVLEETADRIHARAVVLSDGETAVAFCIVDSCLIRREIVDQARNEAAARTGMDVAHLLIAATHCHSAPSVTPVFQSPSNSSYEPYLIDRIAEVIRQAHDSLEPAQWGYGEGQEPMQVFNRRWLIREGETNENPFGKLTDRVWMNPGFNNPKVRGPAGPVDSAIPFLVTRTIEGKAIGLLANYSLHYVGGVRPLSGDYFAAFAHVLGEAAGGLAMMSNGTSGDINNIDFSLAERPVRAEGEQADIVGRAVAEAVREVLPAVTYESDLILKVVNRELELGVRKPSEEEIAEAEAILDGAKRFPDGQLEQRQAIYAGETLDLANYPDRVPVRLQVIRIGDVCINAIPCEVFVEIGLELKRRSSFPHSFTIELANGYNGYLPTREQLALGGYETWRAKSSYLTEDAAEIVIETLLEMQAELR